MGFYVNPDNESFTKAANSKIYVDKTGVLNIFNDLINTEKTASV